MSDKNRVHFMNAYCKESENPFGYLLVDNKPDTPADKQVLGHIFGNCHVYLFASNGENYWPVNIRHPSTGRMKWVNLQEDESTVRAFVKDTTKPEL